MFVDERLRGAAGLQLHLADVNLVFQLSHCIRGIIVTCRSYEGQTIANLSL